MFCGFYIVTLTLEIFSRVFVCCNHIYLPVKIIIRIFVEIIIIW